MSVNQQYELVEGARAYAFTREHVVLDIKGKPFWTPAEIRALGEALIKLAEQVPVDPPGAVEQNIAGMLAESFKVGDRVRRWLVDRHAPASENTEIAFELGTVVEVKPQWAGKGRWDAAHWRLTGTVEMDTHGRQRTRREWLSESDLRGQGVWQKVED